MHVATLAPATCVIEACGVWEGMGALGLASVGAAVAAAPRWPYGGFDAFPSLFFGANESGLRATTFGPGPGPKSAYPAQPQTSSRLVD